jgi:hypothetical protein
MMVTRTPQRTWRFDPDMHGMVQRIVVGRPSLDDQNALRQA